MFLLFLPAILSTSTEHGPGSKEKRLSAQAITQMIEELIGQFAYQPLIFIKENAADVLGCAAVDDGAVISGATVDGRIFLFRDGIASRVETVRTLLGFVA
jgi:hypothetical protein